MHTLQFRSPTPTDLPALLELDKLCFGGLWTKEGYQRELDSDCSHFVLLFSECSVEGERDANHLLGLGCYWSIVEEAHITLLAIHPEYRRRGWGRLLLCQLLQKARSQGLERATLEVRASNAMAISLYEQFGFKLAGKRRRYYQDNDEDALILWRGGLQNSDFAVILNEIGTK